MSKLEHVDLMLRDLEFLPEPERIFLCGALADLIEAHGGSPRLPNDGARAAARMLAEWIAHYRRLTVQECAAAGEAAAKEWQAGLRAEIERARAQVMNATSSALASIEDNPAKDPHEP